MISLQEFRRINQKYNRRITGSNRNRSHITDRRDKVLTCVGWKYPKVPKLDTCFKKYLLLGLLRIIFGMCT